MISCIFNGRLGNQMFQIAAAYALAVENDDIAKFAITESQYKYNVFKHLNVLNEPISPQTKIYSEQGFNYTKIPYFNPLIISGFFQSEKYFNTISESIVQLFYPPMEIIDDLQKKYNFLQHESTCSIHVRRGDYLLLSHNHSLCTMNYYNQAIEKIPKNSKFLVFSDDILWCKKNFIGEQYIFIENQKDYMDLYLMTQCKHNIIANSSFSWWGAWLNKNPEKIIITPKQWFGPALQHYNTKDLIPITWKQI